MIAWLDGLEPAAARVEALVSERPVMSWINVAEVNYRVSRDHGADEAETVLAMLRAHLTLDVASPQRVIEAARIKARHAIALADCFAAATAAAYNVPLLTGDPELLEATDLGCTVDDLRHR